jgi:hypothetical protein
LPFVTDNLRELHEGFARCQVVAPCSEIGDRLGEPRLRLGIPAGKPGGLRRFCQSLGPVRPFGREELEGPAVVELGLDDIKRQRPVACERKETQGPLLELAGVRAGRTRKLERLPALVGEQLGMIGDPYSRNPLDPLSCGQVPFRPGGSRDLPVGDVAHQHVPEGVLGLTRTDEVRTGRINSFRASSCNSSSMVRSATPATEATAPAQKSLPTTAAA